MNKHKLKAYILRVSFETSQKAAAIVARTEHSKAKGTQEYPARWPANIVS